MKHHSVRLEYSSPAEWTETSDGRIFGQPDVKITIELPPGTLDKRDAIAATRSLFEEALEGLARYFGTE